MTELETYQHIIATAQRLISEKGFSRTSMNDIVRESGLSKGGVYWHFKSKDAIIKAIVQSIFDEQMQFLEMVLAGEGSAAERLETLVTMVAQSIEAISDAMPNPVDVYAHSLQKPELLELLKQYFVSYEAHFVRLIEEGVREGELVTDNPDATAFAFMSAIEGVLLIHTVAKPEISLADALNHTMHLFIAGLTEKKGD